VHVLLCTDHQEKVTFVTWENSKIMSCWRLQSAHGLHWHKGTEWTLITNQSENFFTSCCDSSVGIALGYRLDNQVLGFDSLQGLEIFLTTMSRTALGPTQPPIQWVPGALSLEVKQPGCEADHSPPSSAEVKNVWSYTSTPPIHLHGMVLS
jgi:hypothetical protein